MLPARTGGVAAIGIWKLARRRRICCMVYARFLVRALAHAAVEARPCFLYNYSNDVGFEFDEFIFASYVLYLSPVFGKFRKSKQLSCFFEAHDMIKTAL